jgi:cysteine synthase A
MSVRVNESVLSIIGHTPLIKLNNRDKDLHFNLYAKLEWLNPGGSTKDRPAINIIKNAIDHGVIKQGTIVIESSSGNMGIGLAQVCSYYGLRFICVVDPKTTSQNIRLMKAYGAEVEIVNNPDPVTGEYLQARIDRVHALCQSFKNTFWTDQYSNIYNAHAHRQTMYEIDEAMGGNVDYLFCATSTCGTIRGCAEYIGMRGMNTKVIAIDAVGSIIFTSQPAKRLIPGHGAAVRPKLFQPHLAYKCVHISDLECVVGCRRLVKSEAILAGGSSGAVFMAIEKMKQDIPSGSNCVLILCDRGERYLDTIYSDDWVADHFGNVSHFWQEEKENTCVSAIY